MMKKKNLGIILFSLSVLAVLFFYKVTYHGEKSVALKSESQVKIEDVIAEARKLNGKMYDPLQGRLNNILGKMGFIVCIDVPVLSYRNAGYSIKNVLAADFKKHPEHYDTRAGNNPQNPFFHRRAKNLFMYCKTNDMLISVTQGPKPGDVVFYSRNSEYPVHVAMVTMLEPDGGYMVFESTPETVLAKELDYKEIEARGYTTVGFGRLLKAAVI